MNRFEELRRARNKIIEAQEKLSLLNRQKVSQRSDQYKYWRERFLVYSAYEKELLDLFCSNCDTQEIEIGKTIMASGEYHIRACCPQCGFNLKKNGQWISHKNIPGELVNSLPVLEDYSASNPLCEVCQEAGTQLHHWAPVELFGRDEAEKWPKSYLCTRHHQQWHNIVTIPFRSLRKRQEHTNGANA